MCGLLATILISPREENVDIYIDNLTVVNNFKELVQQRDSATARQRLRSADAQWWAMVHYAFLQQGQGISVHWVRGHAGHRGNEAADTVAKAAHGIDTGLWRLDATQHHDLKCHAQFATHSADLDLRRILKLQSAVRHHYQWTLQHRTRTYIKDWRSVAWAPTLRILHDNNPPKRLYTSLEDCRLRSHRIKKLHGDLPTLQAMKKRHPDIYQTDICRRCEREPETNDHLWRCSATLCDQRQEWRDAVEEVELNGYRAWRQAVRKWEQEREEAERKDKPFTATCPNFSATGTKAIWESMQWIQGTAERRGTYRVAEGEEPESEAVWEVKDLYRGLVPTGLIETWKQLFTTTKWIATIMVTKFVSRIEEFGRTKIWNKRCEDTVAWEKSVGITFMSKRAGGRNGDRGHQRSVGDFSDLKGRRLLATEIQEVIHNGTEQVSAAFGVVVSVDGGPYTTAFGGRVGGYASSTIAEMCGLLATILISPREENVDIYIDNLTVVNNFKELVQQRDSATARQRLRSADAQWWAMVHYAFLQQGQGISVHWVRGHAGHRGNEAADTVAKAAHGIDTGLWRLDATQHHDLKCHAQFATHSADLDLRRILKLQSAVRHHYQWTLQHRTRTYIKDWRSVAWAPTLRILHDNNPPKRLYTSLEDCRLRSHRIKKLHGDLPTLQAMKKRHPDTYQTDICRRCERESETNDHLWRCSATLCDQRQEWRDAVEEVELNGYRAWRQAVRKWEQEREEAERKDKPFTATCPNFSATGTKAIWESMQWIQGTAERRGTYRVAEGEEPESEAVWEVKDLYRGLVPTGLIETWKQLFTTTKWIATIMVTKFVSRIEEFGRTKIWNKRCEDTVAWEKSVGITFMSKRAGGRNGDRGHQRSVGDFSDLKGRRLLAAEIQEGRQAANYRETCIAQQVTQELG
ncbi:hypothetical protein BC939DRAFT_502748 [Gamsiella multidivaricata]|uniref:uncharacterized protein n=1 Tax=Gamsiella multidivaricata TaxID=101098 RepID=UPI00221E915B|nr:uncharacterized protein BC939DRAFT_502748 [Gamsiella multidivaricata]KAI7824322.1 hypothetical protein BC939DRAFT_502748 [Gamsiella multidivaricata]